jgi:hypothetical protein
LTAIPKAHRQSGPVVIRPTTAPRKTGDVLAEALVKLNPTFSIAQASALLGICPATTRRHSDMKQIEHARTPGDQRTFTLADILTRLRAAYQPGYRWPSDIEHLLTVWLPSPIVTLNEAAEQFGVPVTRMRVLTQQGPDYGVPHLRYSITRYDEVSGETITTLSQRLFKQCDLDSWRLTHQVDLDAWRLAHLP